MYDQRDFRNDVALIARNEAHVCPTARTGTAALQVYLVSRSPVKFHSRSEYTGKKKHLLPVPGI